MKFTLQWLKEHLDTSACLDDIVERLTMIGLEVDKVHDRSRDLKDFVVGKVLETQNHPDADRLHICQVDIGTEKVEVVCGAPNVRKGMLGVFAPSGSYIPGTGILLKPTKIRGVLSNGMLLSEREVNISDDHDGIIELVENFAPGTSAAEAMGLSESVIEIEITPNRGDCLGVRGVARDLAASGIGILKQLDTTPVKGKFRSPIRVNLDLKKSYENACPFFVGRFIREVKNIESPNWLKDKLIAVGLRPISSLVDITNLMTLDLNRPLHVFDAANLKGDLQVRISKSGEKFLALDGKEYELDSSMTVIADDNGPKALGGIIGGADSGCNNDSKDVFIESAYFNPIRTARTGRKLNILSDARYRFERTVDPKFLVHGMEIATRLILEICGGKPSELVFAGEEPKWERKIKLRLHRIENFGGIKLKASIVKEILSALGFDFKEIKENKESLLQVHVPSWRPDIVGEACLVEEVIRIYGYDKIPAVSMESVNNLPSPALNLDQRRCFLARRRLAGRGLTEVVTYSFICNKHASLFGGGLESLKLINPISSDLDYLRPSLLPNLITAVGRNFDRGSDVVSIFEIGPRFTGDKPEDQDIVVAGVRFDQSGGRHWSGVHQPVDVFDVKADALDILGGAGVSVEKVEAIAEAPSWYHPGHSGLLRLGPKQVIAHFGEIHPGVLQEFGVKGIVYGFEVFLDSLPVKKDKKSKARPHIELSQYQAVKRDFAFVVDEDVTAEQALRAVRGADKKLITDVSLFDVFRGGELDVGKKSLAVTVVFQPKDKTLTDAEIDSLAEKIVVNVKKITGGLLRG
ncbi:MAG: phenylalanine--tRNA ligase subunit beta [Pseudomonadota bacterium]|nr:phenylalanine--tRNA ligase subunit beta [Pseudomonadota bacterium]